MNLIQRTGLFLAKATLIVAILLPLPAFAADTAIDLTPLITWAAGIVILVLGAVLLAILSWVSWLTKKKIGIEIDAGMRKTVADYVTNKANEILAHVLNNHQFEIDVKNPMIATAGNDAVARIPDALAHFGISPAGAADWLSKFVVAKLGELTKDTPDVPTLVAPGIIPGTVAAVPAPGAVVLVP